MVSRSVTNGAIAEILQRIADALQAAEENPFRVGSYRKAAAAIGAKRKPLAPSVRTKGAQALNGIPGIGEKIAGVIEEFVKKGRVRMLEELEREIPPEKLFTRIPGITPGIAKRLKEELHLRTVEDLQRAAARGKLADIKGVGKERAESILTNIGQIARPRKGRRVQPHSHQPGAGATLPVGVILDVDAEYRGKAAGGRLKMIAPKKLNPEGKKWLPILSTERDGWKFTVMYSNTARAHELGKTNDWVVVYFSKTGTEEQCTVVTEQRGPLKGKRVIRGREKECADYYA